MTNNGEIDWNTDHSSGTSSFTVEVNGQTYQYIPEIQEEEPEEPGGRGMQKVFHTVIDPQGNKHDMDWSPHSYPTEEEVAKWVELGMPARTGTGPLDSEQLATMTQPTGLSESEKHQLRKWAGMLHD